MKSFLKDCYNKLLTQSSVAMYISISYQETPDFSDELFNPLNDKWFEEFITHPQVNSVLVDAINYHFTVSMDEEAKCNAALLDNACNWCIEIMQKNWNQEDVAVAAFRNFWSLLLLSQDEVLQSQDNPGSSQIIFLPFERHFRSEKRLLLELQQDFVPKEESYRKICQKYARAIKNYYCNGFIYMLGEFRFNTFYIPPKLSEKDSFLVRPRQLWGFKDEEIRNKWKNIFDEDDILYVIGVPGSGKSLFLRNMINNYEGMTFHDSQDYLIIYCDMKAFYTNGSVNKKSVPDFLQESIINTVGIEKEEITIDFIRYHLQIGRCIVLMDALDEVHRDNRMALHKKVVSFFKTTHPNNKVCITSRARGFLPQEDVKVFYISELTATDIGSYLDKMIALGKFKESDKDNFLDQAQVLIDKNFLTNFLTLSLMVNIYKAERELPENKIELYKKCFEYIAKKREIEKGSRNSYDWEKVGILMKDSTFISLSTLAAPNNTGIARKDIEDMLMKQYHLKYSDEATTERAVQQFLDFCSSRTDLFVLADSDDQFKFFHRSFFEYFYSRYITQQGPVERMYDLMSQFDEDSEVFELVIALIKEDNEEKYQELVKLIFDKVGEELHASGSLRTAFQILTLSMPVIDDAYFRNKYVEIVIDNLDWMTSKSAQQMNQDAISIALKRCFQTCPESASLFQQKYKTLYICYVMGQFRAVSMSLKRRNEAGKQGVSHLQLSFNYASSTAPFYIHVYPDTDALQEELSSWGASEIQSFLATMPSSKEKRKLQNALKYFAKCSALHKKEVFELLSNKSSNSSTDILISSKFGMLESRG